MANRKHDPRLESLWRDALRRHARSGLSIRAFCKQNQLSESSFHAWKRNLQARDAQSGSVPDSRKFPFVPVVVRDDNRLGAARSVVRPLHPLRKPESRQPDAIVIELRCGRRLRLPEAISPQRLAELIVALENTGNRP